MFTALFHLCAGFAAKRTRKGWALFTGETQDQKGKKLLVALSISVVLIASGILLLDLFSPRGVSVATLYVIPIILAQRANSALFTSLTAIFCGILTSIGIILSPDIGVPASVVIIDYAITLVVLVSITALGLIANRRSLHLQTVSKLLTMCAWTKKVKIDGEWILIEEYLNRHSGVTVTHGMSEELARKLLSDMKKTRACSSSLGDERIARELAFAHRDLRP